jgi:hypothetical protein
MINRFSNNVYVVKGKVADVGVTFGTAQDIGFDGLGGSSSSNKAGHVPLGKKDETLLKFHELASQSPNKWALIKTKRDFLLGKGIEIKTRKVVNGERVLVLEEDAETEAIEVFLEQIDYHNTLKVKALDFCFSGRYYIKMVLGKNRKVENLTRVDAFHCRPRRMANNENRISAYFLNPNFGTKRFKESENVELPAYDPGDPTAYPVCIIDVKEIYPGQCYHPIGEWWGTEDWTLVANKIPKFHNSGLDNGYNIKYHISVPDDYFKKEEYPDGYDEERLKNEVLDNIGDTLSGIDNVDKALFTFHRVLNEGRYAESGIKIVALPNPMSDDAYTKINQVATQASAQGHRLLPVMAGIDAGGKLGGSGKELEAAANFQQGFLTFNDRELLLADFEILKKIMGWSRNKVAVFEDIKLYTFDVTPTNAAQNPHNDNAN